ncbi:MAG: tRNA (adenosine(37)-N6)-threonylcarbamoyltransferase complex dimerization subunit type 1 TsaB [Chloroflexota bacterium]
MSADGRRRVILAIDTATSRALVATGSPYGVVERIAAWTVGYRHSETLLPAIQRVLAEASLRRADLVGIVVGTGPGAFTGLRVGIATAKGLALGLGIPLAGVSTADALLRSAGEGAVLVGPAGPRDRVVSRPGVPAERLTGADGPVLRPGEHLVAVDLEGRAPADAVALGVAAWDGIAAALMELGAARLEAMATADPNDRRGDLETLVPDYVTLPRGVAATGGEVAWSRDHR